MWEIHKFGSVRDIKQSRKVVKMSTRQKKKRLLLIGLDAATWNVLNPLLDEGFLPNLQRLKESGCHGVLKSIFPPVTGSAWMSVATGKSPGQTGVFDFLILKDRATFQLRPISSDDFKRNGAIWDYLSSRGKKVGIVNYPMLFPPYKINGIMISGIGAAEDSNIFYPASLKEELRKAIGPHKMYVSYPRPKYANPKIFIRDIKELIDYNYKLADYLIDDTYDFFIFIVSASDFLSHYAWHWWQDKGCKYHYIFKELWRQIDNLAGLMLKKWGDGEVMVISDHGMGRLEEIFLINQWLREEGYLVLRGDKCRLNPSRITRGLRVSLRTGFDLFARLFPSIGDYIFIKFIRKKVKKYYGVTHRIDFNRTKAFALKHSGLGNIYINAENESEYENIKGKVISGLRSFCQNSGRNIEIFSREELYRGSLSYKLPDIIFMINDNSTEVVPSTYKDTFFRKPIVNNKTGSHRIEGIFIMSGPFLKDRAGLIDNPELKDIFSAICCSLGMPLVGEVSNQVDLPQGLPREYGSDKEKDTREVIGRLEDLGYL